MTWYDINLNNEKINKLNALFSSSHYSLEKSKVEYAFRVYIKSEEEKIFQHFCILSYSKENMAIYPAMIEQLPKEIQMDIRNKIQAVKGLEEVVRGLTFLL